MGDWLRKDGQTVMGLLEWTTAAPNIGAYLVVVEERVPTDGNRPEEIHTLKVDGFFSEGPRPPTDLRDVLLKVPNSAPNSPNNWTGSLTEIVQTGLAV
ncbi:hypothetical protein F5883DRAFT_650086 [Diaporthe sp. PMI_573]|nr:hypothetical protein F5883DRAFT_655606 [Diaporthaceae sp. PMI_573]KAH8755001.1 hypothetical protein F5883DRAFT_650086 [Diaporthaceae sp. PMI_573]